ncbi:alpha/beta family hydrolase [Microbacterium sp. C7(2022)]|uniref:alpha/beta hydrolase family protein n=1 Tax=Microbacterium sp. C7(2022) TaxID=2992759 RepID=UPI00237AD168|nr:alpha/beta family hydrolase [Microbacterium sp. C7(2022)]MDE0545699.1 dienelactone hydrolase family protein [Microbacterium sp. C7(2022)]
MIEELEAEVVVRLPKGDVTVSAWHAIPAGSQDVIVCAHGAGAGVRHPFFDGLIDGFHHHGIATVRFTFPYLQAGRRMPGPAAHAIATWAAIDAHTRALTVQAGTKECRLWAAGKSYGGRMASMAAAQGEIDPTGLVYLGYPLHPPGNPEKPRVEHLPDVVQPQLFISGTRDPFVDPHEQLETAIAGCRDAEIEWVDGGGHSFEVAGLRRSPEEVGRALAERVSAWVRRRSQRPAA